MFVEKLKRAIKWWLPPVMVHAIRVVTRPAGRNQLPREALPSHPVLEYAPEGWDAPLPGKAAGWNTLTVIDEVEARWLASSEQVRGSGPLGFSSEAANVDHIRNVALHNVHISFAYVLALAAHHRDRLSVLDWGSALGHYYLIACAVLPSVDFDYHCKDVPLLVERGRVLNPNVTWWTDDRCLDRTYRLVVISGSLQCMQEWREFIPKVARAVESGGYLLLTRLPVVDGEPFVAIHHYYGSAMHHQQFNRTEVLAVVASTGLRLVRELVVGDHPKVANAPEQCEMKGWLFKKGDA